MKSKTKKTASKGKLPLLAVGADGTAWTRGEVSPDYVGKEVSFPKIRASKAQREMDSADKATGIPWLDCRGWLAKDRAGVTRPGTVLIDLASNLAKSGKVKVFPVVIDGEGKALAYLPACFEAGTRLPHAIACAMASGKVKTYETRLVSDGRNASKVRSFDGL